MRFRIRIRIKGPAKWLANAASVAGRSLTHAVAQGVKGAGDLVGKVPIVGSPLHSVLSVATGPFMAIDAIAHGARIDRAVLNVVKNEVTAIRELAPYVKMIATSIPGLGSGIGAGLAMATALANGQPITEAVIAGVAGAVPGGIVGKAVFEVTQKALSGENVIKATVNAGLSQLPPAAQKGLDLVARAAKGENIPKAALDEARKLMPPEVQKAVDMGVAIGQGQKLQNVIAEGVAKISKEELGKISSQGAALVRSTPLFAETVSLVANAKQSNGFNIGAQVLGYTGVNELTITQFRAKLSKEEQIGYDLAISARAGKVRSNPAPKGLSPKAMAGFYATKGMSGGGPKMNTAQMRLIARNKEARKGAAIAIKQMPKKGWWVKIKEFIGVG